MLDNFSVLHAWERIQQRTFRIPPALLDRGAIGRVSSKQKSRQQTWIKEQIRPGVFDLNILGCKAWIVGCPKKKHSNV